MDGTPVAATRPRPAPPIGPDPPRGRWAASSLTFAFEPYGLWWLAPIAVAILALAVRGLAWRPAAVVGITFGLAEMVVLLHWVGIYVGPVPWLVLAVFEALYFAPLAIGLAFALRLPVPLAVIGGAGVWVAEEAVRTRWPYGGFGWGRLAFSQADAPTLHLASIGGAPLITYVVAAIGLLLAQAAYLVVRRAALGRALLSVALGVALALGAVLIPAPTTARQVRDRRADPGQRARGSAWTSRTSASRCCSTTSPRPNGWQRTSRAARSPSRTS